MGATSGFLLVAGFVFAKTDESRVNAYNKLTKTINIIQQVYVDKVSLDKIIDKAIAGLLSNLDAHSSFLDEKKLKDLEISTQGEFGGLGIQVGLKDGALTIIAPIDGTPAAKIGLKAGDIILKINEESTLNMSVDDAINLMRGKPKTSIKITIYRKSEPKPLVFNIIRDIIKNESVYARNIANEPYLYIRVAQFDKNVTDDVNNAIKKAKNPKGIILDLRNNPGGLLNQAVGLSDLFIKSGIIVSQKGQNKAENSVFNATGRAPYPTIPLVVLINSGSASASEIVAGALQDNKRALLIGEKSFGKGSVQVILPLNKTEAIKLTTAQYYLPSGRTIQAKGINPDVTVYPAKVPLDANDFSIKEADLKNHLQNELEKISKKPQKDQKEKSKPKEDKTTLSQNDINQDLQLKSAIDLLKSWNILKPTPIKQARK